MKYPLSVDDLKQIVTTVESVVERLRVLEDGDPRAEGLMVGIDAPRVPILVDDETLVGEVCWHGDGWWAFYPEAVSE